MTIDTKRLDMYRANAVAQSRGESWPFVEELIASESTIDNLAWIIKFINDLVDDIKEKKTNIAFPTEKSYDQYLTSN